MFSIKWVAKLTCTCGQISLILRPWHTSFLWASCGFSCWLHLILVSTRLQHGSHVKNVVQIEIYTHIWHAFCRRQSTSKPWYSNYCFTNDYLLYGCSWHSCVKRTLVSRLKNTSLNFAGNGQYTFRMLLWEEKTSQVRESTSNAIRRCVYRFHNGWLWACH